MVAVKGTATYPPKPGAGVGKALCLAWAAVAGTAFGEPAARIRSGASVSAAWTQVQQAIGDARCKTDADCRTIAVGEKACGGPEAYLAWSVLRTDAVALGAAAAQHLAARRAERESARAKQDGMASNCAWVGDPGARCSMNAEAAASAPAATPGRCSLSPARAGSGGKAD